MTIEESKRSFCASGAKDCTIDGYSTGEDLPKAKVKLLDALWKGPAKNYRTVNAIMSSARNKFMLGSVGRPPDRERELYLPIY